MIIQTGMRTDIPAFYSEWFMNRVRAGYVLVRNPYNPKQVSEYSLSPDVVDLLAFCTKNPGPMLPYLDELKDFGQYWFVTITPYGKEIEPFVPTVDDVVNSFILLSNKIGVDCVGWRYDPIFISEKYSIEYHVEAFEKIASSLKGYTKTCVISFLDRYEKVKVNFPEAREVPERVRIELGKKLVEIAGKNGMVVRPCAEGDELASYGANCSGCMTVDTFEGALGKRLKAPKQSVNQRGKQCACILGTDIGAYDTCGHLCLYCYANANPQLALNNLKHHNPLSPFLLGDSLPGDVVHKAKQKSWIDNQLVLPFL